MSEMITILKQAVSKGASDVHMVIGKPPLMRLHGKIMEIGEAPALTPEHSKKLIYSVLYESQRTRFEENWELDSSFEIENMARFRVNVFMQNNGVEGVFRVIPDKIPTPEQIGLAPEIVGLSKLNRGLVLVTGPTGSGKSTTLACLLEQINQSKTSNVITIEDPIEFTYENKKSIFRQREVGQQTKSFTNALRAALRQDPDVILVGEMRDLETIQLAITAAETGHLCFATLHTQDAASTIDRIIDVFPPHQQTQIRVQLSTTLRSVVSQHLLPRANSKGLVAAREVMLVTPAISNLIRESKTHMIYNAIETSGKHGMVSMDKALAALVKQDVVSYEEAAARVRSVDTFKQLVGR
jgi:twitching motility protein PilT